MPTVEDAILLATNAHRGQTDKAGLPYITHPLRVMSMFVLPEEEDERVVAVLHDVVEDCEITLLDLEIYGFSPRVVDAVNAITDRKGESYEDYIERVAQNPLALKVKLADLADNLDVRRKSTRTLSQMKINKYVAAQTYLKFYQDGITNGIAGTRWNVEKGQHEIVPNAVDGVVGS
jgi:(p)ppGpp synthase/HD superfamily hydrolase